MYIGMIKDNANYTPLFDETTTVSHIHQRFIKTSRVNNDILQHLQCFSLVSLDNSPSFNALPQRVSSFYGNSIYVHLTKLCI